jgi:hypothetical protein
MSNLPASGSDWNECNRRLTATRLGGATRRGMRPAVAETRAARHRPISAADHLQERPDVLAQLSAQDVCSHCALGIRHVRALLIELAETLCQALERNSGASPRIVSPAHD